MLRRSLTLLKARALRAAQSISDKPAGQNPVETKRLCYILRITLVGTAVPR